jgi:hypothetical protein
MKKYTTIMLLSMLVSLTSSLFATVDVKSVFVSNTSSTPSAGKGTLVIDIMAVSNAGSVTCSGFQTGILLDANLIAQYVSVTFSNQLFPAANYTTTQDFSASTGPGRIRWIYTYNTGAYSTINTTDTRVVTLTIVYTMTAAVNGNIAWRVGTPTLGVFDAAAANITGSQVALAGNLSNIPLPVELTSLTASVNQLNAELKWSTATEVNNYGFEVERRAISDQQSAVSSWAKVGFVNGNGTSNVQHSYSFSDNITESGSYAYRLKQIDNSGTFKYSQETQVTIEVPKVFTVSQNYPNPFNPTTNIDFTVAADGKAVLKVYNTLGQEVAELYNGEAQAGRIIQTHFDASRLASGIYFSRLEADGKSLVKRMMFIK